MSSVEISSVQESLKGLVASRRGLEVYLDYNIVTRADRGDDKFQGQVKVISGGGAGHEPGHAGFVGRGFLTTAISGSIFTSPPVNAIVKGIQVTGAKEIPILLIVTNYTGDRLNFSLAATIARSRHGYENIRTILVADDIALENVPELVGNRGLAGTILIHKIAGAMSDLGRSLEEIYSFCNLINANLSTIGFTFQTDWTCNNLRNVEMGKGVHGEPGALKMPDLTNFGPIVKFLMDKFRQRIANNSPVLVLLNNLGGTSQHLFQLFSNDILKELNGSFRVLKIISGTFFTSLDNQGVSVTVLNLIGGEEEILQYIEHDSEVYWDYFRAPKAPPSTIKAVANQEINFQNPFESRGVKVNGMAFRKILLKICETIAENKTKLNEMDQEFGDGDTGNTLARGATEIQKLAMKQRQADYFDYPYKVFQDISYILSSEMGGTSGALLGIFFESAAPAFRESNFSSALWLQRGCDALSEAGRTKRGYRTMLDVLLAAHDTLSSSAGPPDSNFLDQLKRECQLSAESTKDMIPKSGRAVYTNSEVAKSSKYPDPGAAFVSLVVDAIVDTLQMH